MPPPALLLILATLVPLASFILLVFIGKRLGNPVAGIVATLAIGVSFVCSLLAMMAWLKGGSYHGYDWGSHQGPINVPMQWIPVGTSADPNGVAQDHPGFLDIGVYVDSLTILMFNMVTLVATLVHVFSIGYMHEDKRFPRFFTYLGLFCFSMLGLVIGGTLLQLFIFWELVGLCSYLLIGFWYEKKSASNAAIKAFVTNRVGDFGFLIGFGILFYHLGNATLPNLWGALGAAGNGGAITLANGTIFSATLLTVMGIGLFFGAVGKSAQFPLHVWLPDAMEGPTPVSALIHAATMVAAGVYLVGRIHFILTPDAKLFIAIIGATTLTMAALIAIAQSDIKKVLAYSTLSQLGYMMLAMGIGSWVGGLFHLITHAFFKALLFLGSGSVIHAAHHEQELPQYGGLMRKIPLTGLTFLIAVFAIAGMGFGDYGFAGYFSKDMIIAHAGAFAHLGEQTGHPGFRWFFWLPTGIAVVTSFYMMRCWMLTFWGKPRNQHLYDHAHESTLLVIPLIVLALFSMFGGSEWLGIKSMLKNSLAETQVIVRRENPTYDAMAQIWAADQPDHGTSSIKHADDAEAAAPSPAHAENESDELLKHGWHFVHSWMWAAWAAGLGLGFIIYLNGYAVARIVMQIPPLAWIHSWLYHRMYFDELYYWTFVRLTLFASAVSATFDRLVVDGLVNLAGWLVKQSSFLAGWHDKYVIDGAVNGAAALTQDLGAAVRAPQTGRIRVYVTVLIAAVAMGLAGAIIVVLSK